MFVSIIQVSAFRGRTINGGTKCPFPAVQLAPLLRVRLDLLRQGRHRHIVRPAVAVTHIHMLVGPRKAEVAAITTIITIRPRLHPPHSGLRIRINSLIRDQAAVIKMLNRCQDRAVLLIRHRPRPHSRIRSNLEYNISNNSFIRSTRLLRY